MPVRTARLAVGSAGVSGAGVVMYTCPTGKTAIIKDIRVGSTGGAAADFLIGGVSGPAVVRLLTGNVPAGDVRGLQPWIVLEPGDEIFIVPSVTGALNYWLSGTELDGVAP